MIIKESALTDLFREGALLTQVVDQIRYSKLISDVATPLSNMAMSAARSASE